MIERMHSALPQLTAMLYTDASIFANNYHYLDDTNMQITARGFH